jgi:hypothetical protein
MLFNFLARRINPPSPNKAFKPLSTNELASAVGEACCHFAPPRGVWGGVAFMDVPKQNTYPCERARVRGFAFR